MTEMEEQAWADWIRERDDPQIARARPEALDDITGFGLELQQLCRMLLLFDVG